MTISFFFLHRLIVIKANLEGEKDTKWNLQEKRNFRKDAQNTSYKLKWGGKKPIFFSRHKITLVELLDKFLNTCSCCLIPPGLARGRSWHCEKHSSEGLQTPRWFADKTKNKRNEISTDQILHKSRIPAFPNVTAFLNSHNSGGLIHSKKKKQK